MVSDVTIYTTLAAETKWVEDRWCATLNDLPLYAYGHSAEEATARLSDAMNGLIDTLMSVGGRAAVDVYMKRAGITLEMRDCTLAGREPLAVIIPIARSLESK
jgi:hypothetical protein